MPPRINGHSKHDRHHRPDRGHYETSTMMSSDLETTSFFDSEDDTASRYVFVFSIIVVTVWVLKQENAKLCLCIVKQDLVKASWSVDWQLTCSLLRLLGFVRMCSSGQIKGLLVSFIMDGRMLFAFQVAEVHWCNEFADCKLGMWGGETV